MAAKILVVDDEIDVREMVELHFKNAGYTVITAETGSEGLNKARQEKPSLIILDLMLPEMSGLEICKSLKKNGTTADIPILMLTAKAEEVDKIVGLELGADDYVTKPFSPRELVLRVQSILRRRSSREEPPQQLKMGGIEVDLLKHEVKVNGKIVDLTATEFKLLTVLMERRGRVQARDRLLNDVWGYESVIDTRTVDTHVRRLRDKLDKYADYVETVRGFGYRMSEKIE